MDGALGRLALARGTLDRRADLRPDPELVERLRADPATRVLSLLGSRVMVDDDGGDGGRVRLLLRPAHEVGDAEGRLWFYLGRAAAGIDHLAAADPGPDDDQRPEQPAGADPGFDGARAHTRLAGLREIGQVIDDTGAGLATSAVALSNWHATHTRCPRCGAPTEPEQGGWVRRCTADGTEHYPRTDPAVIVSVTDADDRLLLGRNPGWPEGRFSTLAGFVEPGESIEEACAREVQEEAGLRALRVTYHASQPWPFPSSLMFGLFVEVEGEGIADGVELEEVRWLTRDEARAMLDGRHPDLLAPNRYAIAHVLLTAWVEGRTSL